MNTMIHMIIIFVLFISSIEDIRTKKVCIWKILISAVFLLLLLIIDKRSPFFVLGGMFTGIIVILISIITKGKMGIGDGLVLIITGFGLGLWKNLELFLYSLFIAAIFSIVLLIFKRINKKDSLPFVPFIFIGYIMILLIQKV